jgi:hypothetical protein
VLSLRVMRHFLFSTTIFLFSNFTLAQNSSTTFEDIENADELTGLSQMEEELEISDFDSVDDLSTLNKNNQSAVVPRVTSKPKVKTKWTPQAFRAILKKGSLLVRVKDGEEVYTSKRVFVKARERVVGGTRSYLLTKGNKARYLTSTKNLVSISEDLKLYPQIDPRQTYEGPTQFHSTDKVLKLETDITCHLESMNVSYFTLFYGGDGAGASGNGFGIRTFYRSSFPFNVGLGFSRQSGSWLGSENLENVSWDALYFGPFVKYDLYQGEKLSLNGQFGLEKSFGLETISESGDSFSFKSLLWKAEIKALYDTLIGTLSIGLEYKKQRATMTTNNVSGFLFFTDKGSITATGLVLGYHFDLSL